MQQKDLTGIIPAQYTGEEIKADAGAGFTNEAEAKESYKKARERLLSVNDWHKLAGIISARFQLIDAAGKEIHRYVQEGDYLRIDIPGPGSKEGQGYDWVLVEELREVKEKNVESTGFRVRPCENPFGDTEQTAHFYADTATSSFIITRENKTISALIVDRNIKPNQSVGSLMDKIRNTAVGMGAIASFSKIQWKSLAEGLIAESS